MNKISFLRIIPVLPSLNIDRDIAWYKEKLGLEVYFFDTMYAILFREEMVIHLQWHADTEDDPLLGGSVVRIELSDIIPLFEELVERGTISEDALRINTPWHSNEFGFHDLNNNAFFVMQSLR